MSDVERRLAEMYGADARSRRVAGVRIGRPAAMGSLLASAGAIGVLVIAVGFAAFLVRERVDVSPAAASPSPSALASAAASSAPPAANPSPSAPCTDQRIGGGPLAAVTAGHVTVSLDRVSVDQGQRAQWTFRYFVHDTAPRAATLTPGVEITGAAPVTQLAESMVGPPNAGPGPFRPPREIAPCTALVEVAPTSGVASGPYTVVFSGLALEGVPRRIALDLDLDCPRSGDCMRAGQARPSPTATPDRSIVREDRLVVFAGAGTGSEKGNAAVVKRETSPLAVGELAPSFYNQFHGAISPDGRRAVYKGQREGGPDELYLLDASRPNVQTSLLELPNEIVAANAWSTDGAGILFSVTDAGAAQARPAYSALRTLVLATGEVREVARVEGGPVLWGRAWDRASDRIVYTRTPYAGDAAEVHVIDGGRSRRVPLPEGFYVVDRDARTVAVLLRGTVSVTTIDDPARARELTRLGLNGITVGWRPASREFVLRRGTDARTTYYAVNVDTGALRDIGDVDAAGGGAAFRPDGSALLIDAGRGRTLVLELDSGRVAELPRDPLERRAVGSLRAD